MRVRDEIRIFFMVSFFYQKASSLSISFFKTILLCRRNVLFVQILFFLTLLKGVQQGQEMPPGPKCLHLYSFIPSLSFFCYRSPDPSWACGLCHLYSSLSLLLVFLPPYYLLPQRIHDPTHLRQIKKRKKYQRKKIDRTSGVCFNVHHEQYDCYHYPQLIPWRLLFGI